MSQDNTSSSGTAIIDLDMLKDIGFETVSESIIPQTLKNISPKGKCCYKDSILQGCNLLKTLYGLLETTKTTHQWSLIHIVLVRSEDVSSQASLAQIKKTLVYLEALIKVKKLKIILLGVDLSEKSNSDMKSIVSAGGKIMEYYDLYQGEVGKIFKKIAYDLDLVARHSEVLVDSKIQIGNIWSQGSELYAVILNFESSSAMSPDLWKMLCLSVDKFLKYFGKNDIIAAILFNQNVHLMSRMTITDQLFEWSKDSRSSFGYSENLVKLSKRAKRKDLQRQRQARQSQLCYCDVM